MQLLVEFKVWQSPRFLHKIAALAKFSIYSLLLPGILALTPNLASSSEIDEELADGLDLRSLQFRRCFELSECSVDGVTLIPQIRQDSNSEWSAGRLYWDPLDGIGVLGGGQDDEIDFNERLIIRFENAAVITKIWLTDLYVGEFDHYTGAGAAPQNQEDFEFALINFLDDATIIRSIEVNGITELPVREFNDVYTDVFVDGGDLHFRLVLGESEASLMVLNPRDDTEKETFTSFRLGEVDPEKLELFSDVGQEFPYDLEEIFPDNAAVNLYPEGSVNALMMKSIISDTDVLSELQSAASIGRTIGEVSNGEVAVEFNDPTAANELIFYSQVGTSNDYSVGGILIERQGI